MSRFERQCKFCRCYRENICSEEIKAIMVKQDLLCFAAEDPYAHGDCKLFVDIKIPEKELFREVMKGGHHG